MDREHYTAARTLLLFMNGNVTQNYCIVIQRRYIVQYIFVVKGDGIRHVGVVYYVGDGGGRKR